MPEELNVDVIRDGHGSGSIAKRLLEVGFSANSLRPYIDTDGKCYITVNKGGELKRQEIVINDTTLRKDEWKLLDSQVLDAAKQRLRAVNDLRSRGLTYSVDGMGVTVLQTQTRSDISDADITMDGLRRTPGDRPVYGLVNLPLPIISKDFSFTAREIEASRRGDTPLDTSMAQLAGRKVAEAAEKLLLGNFDTSNTYNFDGSEVPGYLNFDDRLTYTINDWSASDTDGSDIVDDVLEMIKAAKAADHYGPFMLYIPSDFSMKMEEDFKTYSDKTIRERLTQIEYIEDVRTLDYLTDSNVVLVEMDPMTVRLVEGMPLQTVQWPTDGGMRVNFKVMTISVPQLRSDYNSNTGIVVGSTS